MKDSEYNNINVNQVQIIDDALNKFDFDKVQKYMQLTNWTWFNLYNQKYYIPTVLDLHITVKQQLIDGFSAINARTETDSSPIFISSGGFTTYVWPNNTCQIFFAISELFIDRD